MKQIVKDLDGNDVEIVTKGAQLEVETFDLVTQKSVIEFLIRQSRMMVSVGWASILYAYFEDESTTKDAQFWMHQSFTCIQSRVNVGEYGVTSLQFPVSFTLEEAMREDMHALHLFEGTKVWQDEDQLDEHGKGPCYVMYENGVGMACNSIEEAIQHIQHANEPYWTACRNLFD